MTLEIAIVTHIRICYNAIQGATGESVAVVLLSEDCDLLITDIIHWYSYEKGGMQMLTVTDIAIIISIISLCLTCYDVGYNAGKDSTQKHR